VLVFARALRSPALRIKEVVSDAAGAVGVEVGGTDSGRPASPACGRGGVGDERFYRAAPPKFPRPHRNRNSPR
jgi:hypothetical protein